MYRLTNPVQHYAWGSATDIPQFCRVAPDGQPWAEMWIGAHPSAPSVAVVAGGAAGGGLGAGVSGASAEGRPAGGVSGASAEGRPTGGVSDVAGAAAGVRLDEALRVNAGALLGEECESRFGARLPYLVKLLAAAKPLSLQAHPTAAHAAAAHRREVELGVPAAERNYPDGQHKPEMLVALVPTLALAGFRDPDDAADGLERVGGSAVAEVLTALRGPGTAEERVRAGFVAALALPAGAVEVVVRRLGAGSTGSAELGGSAGPGGSAELGGSAGRLSVAEQAVARHSDAELPSNHLFDAGASADDHDVSAEDIARILVRHYDDAGVVASFLLNAVALRPGEGLFVGAGVVHAYVRGFGLEVMASSDNVLRAGLTAKRIDIPELLSIVDFRPAPAHVVRASAAWAGSAVEQVYDTPIEDFRLTVVDLRSGESGAAPSLPRTGPRVVICLDGEVSVEAGGKNLRLSRGASAFIGHDDGELRLGGCGRAAVVGAGVRA